jgi:short-subunit dehydrogenase
MPVRYPYRRALVTGASSGIGECCARELAARGVSLVLVARRGERLTQLADELRASSRISVEVLVADLTDPEQIALVEKRLAAVAEPVDLLVNNAGSGTTGMFSTLPAAGEIDKIALNVTAVLRLCHAVLSRLVADGHGGILNVSSLAGCTPSPRAATYAASKAFATMLSESLSREVGGSGVHVTALLPGPARTELTDEKRFVITLPKPLWMAPEAIARRGLDAVAAGKTVCIPSRVLSVMTMLGTWMPRSFGYLIGDRLWRTPSSSDPR